MDLYMRFYFLRIQMLVLLYLAGNLFQKTKIFNFLMKFQYKQRVIQIGSRIICDTSFWAMVKNESFSGFSMHNFFCCCCFFLKGVSSQQTFWMNEICKKLMVCTVILLQRQPPLLWCFRCGSFRTLVGLYFGQVAKGFCSHIDDPTV